MSSNRRGSRVVPVALGIGMLAVMIAAGLAPNAGLAQASSTCTYGQCVSPATFPTWAIVTSVALVIVALLAALLILRRRRRPPAGGAPVSEWSGSAPPAGPASAGTGPTPPVAPSEWEESSLAAGAAAGGTVGASEWQEPPAEGATMAPPAPPAPEEVPGVEPTTGTVPEPKSGGAAADSEPDIDSLMAELDKISSEILKRTPKKKSDSTAAPSGDDEPPA